MNRQVLGIAGLIIGLVFAPTWRPALHGAEEESRLEPEAVKYFETKVRPVLVEHCVKCHGPQKQKGKLRLDSRDSLLEGGETGPAIVPGNPDESLLVEAINHRGPEMPPSGKLDDGTISVLTRWVEMGAVAINARLETGFRREALEAD